MSYLVVTGIGVAVGYWWKGTIDKGKDPVEEIVKGVKTGVDKVKGVASDE